MPETLDGHAASTPGFKLPPVNYLFMQSFFSIFAQLAENPLADCRFLITAFDLKHALRLTNPSPTCSLFNLIKRNTLFNLPEDTTGDGTFRYVFDITANLSACNTDNSLEVFATLPHRTWSKEVVRHFVKGPVSSYPYLMNAISAGAS
jgi:hypothetical protein